MGLGVSKFGRTSVTFDQVVFSEGKCVASAQSVTVLIDEATRKPTPLTAEILAQFPALAAARRRSRVASTLKFKPDQFKPDYPSLLNLSLPLRRRDHEAVEFVAHLDLARQPRIRPHVEAEIQHVLFHRAWARRPFRARPRRHRHGRSRRRRRRRIRLRCRESALRIAASITVAPFSTSIVRVSPVWSTK